MSVNLRPARETDRTLIQNLFNLYQNDLSAYCDGFEYLDENGYFDVTASKDVLPYGDGVYPYIITENGKNVGFVLYTKAPFAPDGVDNCLEELYLIRPARKRGIAHEVISSIFKDNPGSWCLSVYPKNAPALHFWKSVIPEIISEAPGENGMTYIIFRI